mgnify:CR=1 FL=1
MPKYETIQDYLRAMEEQIRWKRAWPVLCRELRQHMEDQRDDFAAQGFADAEQMAAAEMGDPVPVGVELDRLHRPKPQRGLPCPCCGMVPFCGRAVWGRKHLPIYYKTAKPGRISIPSRFLLYYTRERRNMPEWGPLSHASRASSPFRGAFSPSPLESLP